MAESAAMRAGHEICLGQRRAQPLPEWLASLPREAELLTPDAEPFAGALGAWPVTQTPRALAGAIGRLAETRLQDPILIDANYVRRSDAELHWKDGG